MSDVFQDYGSSFKSESKPRDPKFDQFDDSQSLVHLHVHTEHSFLDGVPKVPQLVDRVTDLGQWAVAITDHGEMSGHLRLQRACQEAEVKPIFGMEGYFTDDRFVKEGKKGENYQHITLLAYSYQGLQNLWALGSLGHIEGQYYGDPRIDWDLLSKYSEGIIATGGCMGGCVARFLHREGKHYDPERAVERIGRFLDVFGDNFYLEIHSFDSPEHRVLNQDLVRVAREFSVPLIGVSDSHYAHPDDWKDHELLAQPLTSLVLTPTGWVKMGDLEKGEEVVGSDGRPTEILGINPRGIQEVYEVTFDDGTRVRSTKDHLWTVYGDAFSDRRRTTVPLSYIIERPHKTFNVPLVDPIEGQEQTFVIDPYLMGALLGDGHFNDSGNVILACSETEILDLCELPEGCSWKDYRDDSYGLIGTGHKNPALQEIRDLGLIDSRARTKYIPPRYLEGSVVQRLRLLQGLMDTDGSVGQDGSVEFGTISPRLAEDVATLVRSLGGSAKVSHYTTQTPIYMVSIRRVYQTWCPFSLARKANRHTQIKTSRTVPRTRGKAIRTIEKVSEEPVQCIMVSNEDGLYVTDDYTLTHNTAVQMGRTMDDPDRFQYGPHQLSVISEMEWRSRLDYLPEGVVDECMTNTTQIAKQANVTIPTETKMPVYFDTIEDDNEYMTRKAWEGFEEKIPRLLNQSMPPTKLDGTPYTEEDYRERLEYELGVVLDKGYSGYFIEVADIVRAAKEEGQLVGPARGSAGGALLSFVLGITEVEPMRAGLIFERFLDPGRVSLPDIDIDFPQHLRERSKTRLKEKYGEHSTATIGTLNTLKPKQALRDFCRGLNIPRGDTEKMSAVIDRTGLSGAPSWDWEEVNSRHRKEFAPWVKKYPYLFQLMDKFSTHIRHAGAHAAGVVVSHESLIGRLPLRYKNGELRTMFDMKDVEAVGLVKIDFLGLRNLSTIMACMDILKETKDPQDLPLHPYEWAYNWEEYYEDPKVWEQIRTGKNIGAFQIETSDLRRLTLEFQPENLQDLCDMISVFRPGITRSVDPDTGMNLLDLYLAKRKGEREVTFPHENLEPVLGVTHGQFVYQEQIMKACTVLAGYTLQETDRVRKILGKMLQEEMKKERVVFVKGCQEHSDIHPSLANQIFNTMETFGTYGYNLAHGWAYAMIAYWTAWYKTHYPHEYMTALFRTNQSRSPLFARECKRMNISILGPDVNESKELFTLTEDGTIRYGLSTVKYLSGGADEVVRNAPFSSMKDFVDRVPKKKCNKRAVVSAILVGTFDSIAGNDGWQERYEGWSPTRIALDEYWEARKDWKDRHLTTLEVSQDEKLKKKHKPRTASENFTLFDEYCEDLQLDVRAKHEQEILGTLVDADPLGDYMDLILKEDTFPGEFEMMLGEKCRLGGIVTTVKNLTTKRGKNPGQAMAQVWIEPASVVANEDGDEEVREALQVVMFPDAWSQFKNSVQLGSPVLADLEKIEGGLSCYRIFKLDDMKG